MALKHRLRDPDGASSHDPNWILGSDGLQVGDVGSLAHHVVPDQAVEVHRRGDPRVDLIVGDFRHRREVVADLTSEGRSAFERRALRGVDDDLKFALVVER